MSIEDRQFQIRERAGLEESRYNQDFIEFLRKWSTPTLVVIAVLAAGYALYQRFEKAQHDRVNAAFDELQAAMGGGNPSPDSLADVASAYEGVRGVSVLARLNAADTYMRALRTRLKVGAKAQQDGSFAVADTLDDTNPEAAKVRETYLAKARELYQKVYDDTSGSDGTRSISVSAIFGLAAVEESSANFAAAKTQYEKVISLTSGGPFAIQAEIAKKRIESIDKLQNLPIVYTRAELPALPEQTPPPITPVPAPITIEPVGPAVPADAPATPPPAEPAKPADSQAPAATPSETPK
jgi:hypothetical protein